MSTSNAMLMCFASGVPYGLRDRQRFELVPKITTTKMCKALSSHHICGGGMSSSNAMHLCFASGVPYGFRDRQRFELVPKITTTKLCKALSSHEVETVFARIRERGDGG